MPLSPAHLDAYFTYHAPTEEQKPKYKAIDDAYVAAKLNIVGPMGFIFRDERPTSAIHDGVNKACRDLVEVIDANSPDSADKTAAIRCVRLARNAANEMYAIIVRDWDSIFKEPLKYESTFEACCRVIDDELNKAKWQSKAAIALDGKV